MNSTLVMVLAGLLGASSLQCAPVSTPRKLDAGTTLKKQQTKQQKSKHRKPRRRTQKRAQAPVKPAVPAIQVQGVPGADVSEYEPGVNWVEFAKEKRFVLMRVSHGLHRDITFLDYWKSAKDNGIIRGAYHYVDPKDPYEPQLRYFVKTLKLEKGDLPPILDLENPSLWAHMKQGNRIRYVLKWIRALERAYGCKPVIYLSPNFPGQVLGAQESQLLKDYPLWIANYHVPTPTIPSPWTSYIMWQYTPSGTCPGVSIKCDLDVAPGALPELLRYTVTQAAGGDDSVLTANDLDDEGFSARHQEPPPKPRRKRKARPHNQHSRRTHRH